MKLVSGDTCRAVSRERYDEFPAELVDRERELRFLEETGFGGRRRRGDGDRFPPYVSGCPTNVAVGAVAAVASAGGGIDSGPRRSTEQPRRGRTIAEIALARYGDRRLGVRTFPDRKFPQKEVLPTYTLEKFTVLPLCDVNKPMTGNVPSGKRLVTVVLNYLI